VTIAFRYSEFRYNGTDIIIIIIIKRSIHSFPCSPQLEHRAPFGASVITHTRHMVGLLWTSDQPVAETFTYTGQHNIYTLETNIHARSGTRPRDPSNQVAADLRLRPRGHWDRLKKVQLQTFNYVVLNLKVIFCCSNTPKTTAANVYWYSI
jgi:hypothetical protein